MAIALASREAVAVDDDAACVVTIVSERSLDPTWDESIRALRADLATRRDCAPTTIVVAVTAGVARLVATTPSGGHAERMATTPSALRAMALGLVASIPRDVRREQRAIEPAPLDPIDEDPVAPTVQASKVGPPRLVGALTAGTRLGMPTRVLVGEATLRADVFVDDWFVAASVRYAPFGGSLQSAALPGFAFDEVAIALGGGRRFRAGPVLLDLAIAPAIVIMTEEADVPADSAGGTDQELRCDLAIRALFGSARFKPAVGIDLELAPFALRHPVRADSAMPPFPSWAIGVGAGLAGDLL